MGLDLRLATDNLQAFVRARASSDAADSVTWFTGTVHAWSEPSGHRQLFRIEGYNIARAVKVVDGFDLLAREAVFYCDPGTGEVLDRWDNPFTGETVEVIHIWNSPVNQRLHLDGPRGPWRIPTTVVQGEVVFDLPIFLAYPSPLPTAAYPEQSQSDVYRAAELFQFFCKQADLERAELASVPSQVSWTRLGPWLPWMRMAQRPGQLVYHAHGLKLADGYRGLPAWIRERVERDGPSYATTPRRFEEPNETSWTYYRKLLEAAP